MSVGEGMRTLPRQRLISTAWTGRLAWLWAATGWSLLGYLALFMTLHLNSLSWAPGQVLEPFTSYWRFIYRYVWSEDQVMAARRSAAAASHPFFMLGALGMIAVGYLGTLYLLRALPLARQPRLRALIGTALLLSVPLLILPNLLSRDIYSYISFGRIATLHAGNPFIDPPGAFTHDMYLQWVGWPEVPSVYGPAWIYLSILLTVLVESIRSSVITYVLAYKLLALALHLANGALIWAILWHWKPEQRVWGSALYLLNPLALIEFAGSGHNDVLMISFILLGILLHLRGWWLWAAAAFTLAVLTKWIALPLIPLYGLLLFGRTHAWRRRVRYIAGCAGVFAGLSIGLYLPYWEGPATLQVLRDAPPQRRLINSLGDVIVRETQYAMYYLGWWPHPAYSDFAPLRMRIPRSREIDQIDGQAWRSIQRTRLQRYNQVQIEQQSQVIAHQKFLGNAVRIVGLLLVGLACLAGALVTRSLHTMLLAVAWIFFVYITVGAVWVWPWYATWFVALAAILDWRVTGRAALLLSLLALLIYPLFPIMPEQAVLERSRALIAFGPPLAFALVHLRRLIRGYRRHEWSLGS